DQDELAASAQRSDKLRGYRCDRFDLAKPARAAIWSLLPAESRRLVVGGLGGSVATYALTAPRGTERRRQRLQQARGLIRPTADAAVTLGLTEFVGDE